MVSATLVYVSDWTIIFWTLPIMELIFCLLIPAFASAFVIDMRYNRVVIGPGYLMLWLPLTYQLIFDFFESGFNKFVRRQWIWIVLSLICLLFSQIPCLIPLIPWASCFLAFFCLIFFDSKNTSFERFLRRTPSYSYHLAYGVVYYSFFKAMALNLVFLEPFESTFFDLLEDYWIVWMISVCFLIPRINLWLFKAKCYINGQIGRVVPSWMRQITIFNNK